MNLPIWWSNAPKPLRYGLQIAWCAFLVFVLVLFWVQKHDFVYAQF